MIKKDNDLIHTHAQMRLEPLSITLRSELIVAALAIITSLIGQWVLSTAIHGSNYYGWDGKMAQAIILAGLKYSGWFQLTNISPIEGVGSQMLTMNVWANPSFWPFAVFDKELATDVSALVALGIFMTCCYLMARCFDVPVVPSAIAAQLCILLFAPALLIAQMPTNFCLTPGDAVVYAPHLVALGLLARIEPGPWRRTALLTAGIFAMLFYSFYADPMWTAVNGYCWSLAFAVVIVSPFRIKAILLRIGALGSCALLFIVSGMAGYLDTISQYTARVQYPALIDRPRSFGLVSALAYSPGMRTFYLLCVVGWIIGLVLLRGRPRVLVAAAATSFAVWVAYSTVYLLLQDAVWVPPIPSYVEHSLWVLYMIGGVAGFWGLLQFAARRIAFLVHRRAAEAMQISTIPDRLLGIGGVFRSWPALTLTMAIAVIAVAYIPAKVAAYALYESAPRADIYYQPWPNEPELMSYLAANIGSEPGQPLRGSLAFSTVSEDTTTMMANAWAEGWQTIDEYSQLVSPQAVYFLYAFLQQSQVLGSLNGFVPYSVNWDRFSRAMQMFGTRYYLTSNGRVEGAEQAGYLQITLPRRPNKKEPGSWWIYELPHPNVGNYSPTEVASAQSAAQMAEKIAEPDFDFTRRVLLPAPIGEALVKAHDMRLSRIRGGLHLSGKSDGSSLIVLPLQYSHCLRATDNRVRFVRANLLMAGMIFTREVDTDIEFDYGIFSPGCRRADLADLKRLDMKIDLRMPHLTGGRIFVDWDVAVARFREVGLALGLLPVDSDKSASS